MIDIIKLCREHHVPFLTGGHKHCRSGWLQLNCPECSGGRDGWHLGWNLRTGALACWRCGGLRFWTVLPKLLRTDEAGVRRALGRLSGSGGAKVAPLPPEPPKVRRREIKTPPGTTKFMPLPHRRYLEGRGFNPDLLIDEWGLMATGHLGGAWSWRIVIPVRNGEGRVVAYQGRAIGAAEPKYLMTGDDKCLENPDSFLYGIDKVEGDSVVVVEGGTGVWRIGAGAVGVLGIGWKREQVNRLRRFKNKFILFDPEPLAQQRAALLAAELSLFPGSTEILSGFATDPGEMSERQAGRVRKVAGL